MVQGEENIHILGEEGEDVQEISKKFCLGLQTIYFLFIMNYLFSLKKKLKIEKRKNCRKPYFPDYAINAIISLIMLLSY